MNDKEPNHIVSANKKVELPSGGEVGCCELLAEDNPIETECRFCHYTNVSDCNFYSCQCCGAESCADCGGRCGCEQEDPS